MTREEFWEIVKKLVRKDYWDAQSVPPKEIKEILTNSLLIPKPKFQVGDKVRCLTTNNEFEVDYYCIYPLTNEVYYFDSKLSKRKKGIAESELELVEEHGAR